MPTGVQDNIASEYLSQYNRPLAVSAMAKLRTFPMLQELGYNGQLGFMTRDFHGLQDWYEQLTAYSSAHAILRSAWAVIVGIALANLKTFLLSFASPVLGRVGNLFKTIHNFGQVFAVAPAELHNPTALANKVSTYSQFI